MTLGLLFGFRYHFDRKLILQFCWHFSRFPSVVLSWRLNTSVFYFWNNYNCCQIRSCLKRIQHLSFITFVSFIILTFVIWLARDESTFVFFAWRNFFQFNFFELLASFLVNSSNSKFYVKTMNFEVPPKNHWMKNFSLEFFLPNSLNVNSWIFDFKV